MLEKYWYPKIQKYLENEGYVCHGFYKNGKKLDFIDTGIGNARIDVLGIKRASLIASNFQLETIGVEVKHIGKITIKNIRQAASYAHLCTRCYLAAPVERFSENDKKNAAQAGVGLIRLKRKRVDVIVESNKFQPDIDLINQFLWFLNVVFCPICRTYKHRYDPKELKYNGGSWRNDIFSKKNKWIYICNECNIKLSKNTRQYLMARELEQIRNRFEGIEQKLAKTKRHVDKIDNYYYHKYLKLKGKGERSIKRLDNYYYSKHANLNRALKKIK